MIEREICPECGDPDCQAATRTNCYWSRQRSMEEKVREITSEPCRISELELKPDRHPNNEEMTYLIYHDDGPSGACGGSEMFPRKQIMRFDSEDHLRKFLRWISDGNGPRRLNIKMEAFRENEFIDMGSWGEDTSA